MRPSRPAAICYKTHSEAKSLILNVFPGCSFSGQSSQALDFSSGGGPPAAAINKVIHTFIESRPKRF
jgi:hypothetical protein